MNHTVPAETRWRNLQQSLLLADVNAREEDCRLFVEGDARDLLSRIPEKAIDAVITSPPYAQMKNYGTERQLGFGQETQREYLRDVKAVLHQLYRVCVEGAALWIVLDTPKKGGRTILLPWEVIHRAEEEGWRLQDVVIWDKGHALPWSHVGRFRGVFEYVLLLSKGRLNHFEIDAIRESDHLSPYWLKYPERFHPDGKAPTDLWHYPIPVQGSWAPKSVRHFCPFPLGMVARMIHLTTSKGGIVLDPFAGTGSVVTVAAYLGRRGVGIDINPDFVARYAQEGHKSLLAIAQQELASPQSHNGARDLRHVLTQLRVLKYPRTLYTQLSRPDRIGERLRDYVAAFVVVPVRKRRSEFRGLASSQLFVLTRSGAPLEELRSAIGEEASRPPLSKFGVQYSVEVLCEADWLSTSFHNTLPRRSWFVYKGGVFHKFAAKVSTNKLATALDLLSASLPQRIPPIFSATRIDISPTIV